MALFGEKYGDKVRVIQYGKSIELCGGTHVKATGNIGMLRIVSESSVAAGVRRIEAVTAESAEMLFDDLQDAQNAVKELFNNAPDVLQAIKKSIEENNTLRKKMEAVAQERIVAIRENLMQKAEDINGVKVIRLMSNDNPNIIKGVIPFFKGKFTDVKFLMVAGTIYENKPSLTVVLSQPMVDAGFHAGNMVREAAKLMDGNGGGQPFMATAGGKNPNGVNAAIDSVIEMIK